MNSAFFGLAVLAALNPKLFAVDLLLIENARPRLMFIGSGSCPVGLAPEVTSRTAD